MDYTPISIVREPCVSVNPTSDKICSKLKIITWNCGGLGSNITINSVKDLIRKNHPNMVILTETMLYGES